MARKKKPARRKRAGGTPIGGSVRRKKPTRRRKKAGGTKMGGGTGIGGGMRKRRRPKRALRAGFMGEIAKHILLGYALNKLGVMGGH